MTGVLNLSGRRRIEVIRQSEAAECGTACLVMMANYHGHALDMPAMRRRFGTSLKGITLRIMMEIANSIHLTTRAIRCEPDELAQLKLPAILHWRGNHFVILEQVTRKRITIVDPALGRINIAKSALSRGFSGVALELAAAPAFKAQTERTPLTLTSMVQFSPNIVRGLIQAMVLSIIIELLVLASPFYMQIIIDEALVKGNIDLIESLAIAFGMVLLFRVAAVLLRGFVIQFISQNLSFDMRTKVFHHLIRLPLEWFSKRQIGDIQSRFGSIDPIQQFISNGAIIGILDGVLGALVLALMFAYSAKLAIIVLISMLLIIPIRVGTLQLERRLAGDLIVNQAFEQTRFLETLRAFNTVKSTGAELAKEGQQRNATAAAVNSMIRAGNIKLASNGANALLDGLASIIVIYVGALEVLSGTLTVGMLMAFVAYERQFGTRFVNLIETIISWKLLSVNLMRLADIALAKKEDGIDGGGYKGVVEGHIECRAASYTYGFGEKPVLSNVNLTVQPGEFVAIVGASGCGKSTLLKVITGLFNASSGKVLLDGRPIKEWDVREIRRQIALVTQEDRLMTGSIAENIALFDEDIDLEYVKSCASLARIDAEIRAMPMGYETLVGDMGSSLSSGQQQRVMIARAIYRRPKVLVLDEGTSHLDTENETALNLALKQLRMTRIIVAHRPETIAAADRRVEIRNGSVFVLRDPKHSATSPFGPEGISLAS
ncbi:peptidase domain-containing ABC transporter [Sphingomonas qomolangmaensis]|uniref:Peptidase domain-containing ABC transporter n=1 Tax=Sphingomonas qomolangmaensis TaxID=2918765 RepID=A0ABY5L9P0_9SPHN|nr:peptidase domain-containing ABC transporter [Sphingomonas qomolangmaensis]UUL82577.1 peptidase domain-containing ABC transporter [Sphingomonas qomolangmaensis]